MDLQDMGDNIEELCERYKIQKISYEDTLYPASLRRISNPPKTIFIKGTFYSGAYFEENYMKSFALVGTRNCSLQGEIFAKEVGRYLKEHQYYNISGLARGIDTVGHIETLGRTGAILGQGLLTEIYPKENKYLAEKILDSGGFLLSELPLYENVSRFSLLKRNRLQTALTRGIIIAETGLQGGTVQTFHYAKRQGKEIYVAEFNYEFIQRYKEDIHIIQNMQDFEEIQKQQWIQQNLFVKK